MEITPASSNCDAFVHSAEASSEPVASRTTRRGICSTPSAYRPWSWIDCNFHQGDSTRAERTARSSMRRESRFARSASKRAWMTGGPSGKRTLATVSRMAASILSGGTVGAEFRGAAACGDARPPPCGSWNDFGLRNCPVTSTRTPSITPLNRLRRSWSPRRMASARTPSISMRGDASRLSTGIETPAFSSWSLSTTTRRAISSLRLSESAIRLTRARTRPPSLRSLMTTSRAMSPAKGSSARRPISTRIASLLNFCPRVSFAPKPTPSVRRE